MSGKRFSLNRKKWTRLVDAITVFWLAVFVLGFFTSPGIARVCNILNIAILAVFAADLVLTYKDSDNRRTFLKRHWLDVLMIIPYFRIFRILRIARLLRVAKVVRVAKVAKVGKASKLARASKSRRVAKGIMKYRKATKVGKRVATVGHESYDLARTAKDRFSAAPRGAEKEE